MLDYYDMIQLIDDIDILISAKEKELEALKTVITNDIMQGENTTTTCRNKRVANSKIIL